MAPRCRTEHEYIPSCHGNDQKQEPNKPVTLVEYNDKETVSSIMLVIVKGKNLYFFQSDPNKGDVELKEENKKEPASGVSRFCAGDIK